jgi:hypothetical protein
MALGVGPEGSVLDDSDYTIDFHQGPVLESTRIVGLAGAVTPFSEGVVGYAVNPASAAMRFPYSLTFRDWELDASVGSPGSGSDTDFDANGRSDAATSAPLFVTLGGGVQVGPFGAGVRVDVNEYEVSSLSPGMQDTSLIVDVARVNAVGAVALLRGQLAFGVGVGVYAVDLGPPESDDEGAPSHASAQGLTAQVGGIWAPTGWPVRAGAALRVGMPLDTITAEGATEAADGTVRAQGYVFPRSITAPTQVHAAVATQLFRPLNPPWRIPSRPGEAPSPEAIAAVRPPHENGQLLLSAGLVLTLPVPEAVGIESFLTQRVQRSGRSTSVSPRVGVEGEPWVDGWVVRGGSYYEPSRFAASLDRLHFTGGFDVHVPVASSLFGLVAEETTFRVSGAIDRAQHYFGWNATVGVWR